MYLDLNTSYKEQMKKKITIIVIALVVMCAIPTSSSFGTSTIKETDAKIENVTQLKAAVEENMIDNKLTKSETANILSKTDSNTVNEYLTEKLDEAIVILNSGESRICVLNDSIIATKEFYELGDGCRLVIELIDVEEEVLHPIFNLISLNALSGESEPWKAYGNRYFTAKATVDCGIASVCLKLENHYILSSNGIAENYGIASCENSNTKVLMDKENPTVTSSKASIVGNSKVSMYTDYSISTFTSGGILNRTKYRLNTSISYLDIDKTSKQIKIRQAWNLTK